jgi:hypothetical protein
MNFNLKVVLAAFVVAFVFNVALAQGKVDQGAPGTQGPWVVRGTVPTFPSDGGVVNGAAISIYPYHCANSSPTTKYACDAGAMTIGGSVNRLYTVVTNAGDDLGGGTGFVKCRPDGVPTLDAGTPGQGLSVGASVNYTNSKGAAIQCICASGTYVGGFECAP